MRIKTKQLHAIERHLPMVAVGGLLALLYGPLLLHWIDGWLNKTISIEHEYYSHGLIGLPFAAYLAWNNRHRWQQLPEIAHASGLVVILLATGLYFSGLSDLTNLSFPLMLLGLCLWFKGWAGLKLQAFPLLFVALATPTEAPYLLVPYTLPLQRFITGTAGFIMMQTGIDVRVDQIYLFVNERIVEVAPYCAGLKMLFTSLYVGLMLLHWTNNWKSRPIVFWFFSGIVAVSVSANIVRNTLLAFFHGTARDQAFVWLHDGWGGDLYSACMLGLLIVLLQSIERWIPETLEPSPDV